MLPESGRGVSPASHTGWLSCVIVEGQPLRISAGQQTVRAFNRQLWAALASGGQQAAGMLCRTAGQKVRLVFRAWRHCVDAGGDATVYWSREGTRHAVPVVGLWWGHSGGGQHRGERERAHHRYDSDLRLRRASSSRDGNVFNQPEHWASHRAWVYVVRPRCAG